MKKFTAILLLAIFWLELNCVQIKAAPQEVITGGYHKFAGPVISHTNCFNPGICSMNVVAGKMIYVAMYYVLTSNVVCGFSGGGDSMGNIYTTRQTSAVARISSYTAIASSSGPITFGLSTGGCFAIGVSLNATTYDTGNNGSCGACMTFTGNVTTGATDIVLASFAVQGGGITNFSALSSPWILIDGTATNVIPGGQLYYQVGNAGSYSWPINTNATGSAFLHYIGDGVH